MRHFALVALLSGLAGMLASASTPGPAAAGDAMPKAVFELFTSQGCSSCPTADALFEQFAGREDVIALSLSVDYWDYLGWKDTNASPKFTERQRAYSLVRGDGMVYTPQMVVNGLIHANGSDKDKIERAIDKTQKMGWGLTVPIRLQDANGKLVIETGVAPEGTAAKDATLWLAMIARKVEVPIKRGENQGKIVTYYNVVRELTPVGMWSGKQATVQLERDSIARPGIDRCAVLLQQGKAGPIIGAAMLRSF